MAEILKERSELDPQFQWDLTSMFESDAAWETALENLDAEIDSVAAFAGQAVRRHHHRRLSGRHHRVEPQGRAALLLRQHAPR